jgi:hypothetical protein
VFGVLAFAWTVRAASDVFVYEDRTITAAEVEVRSGPSMDPKFYPTSKLHQGDVVKVVKNRPAQNGWIAIKPPRGSFSWINAVLVQVDDHTGVVRAEDSPVLIGSALTNSPPSVRTTPLPRGATVVILDKPLVASDGSRWLPIEPHITEVRYIPASALEGGPVHAVASKPAGPVNAPASAGPESDPAGDIKDPRFLQAQQAEREGRYADAEKLYQQLADQTTDPNVKLVCLNRLSHLRPTAGPQANLTGQIIPTPANQGATGAVNPAAAGQWSGPGWFRKAGFNLDGKQVYAFQDYRGQHLFYLMAEAGVSLDQYVNRNVNVYGKVGYRGDTVRANFMTVSHIQPLQ